MSLIGDLKVLASVDRSRKVNFFEIDTGLTLYKAAKQELGR
jgi:hypothetical protein